MQRIFLILALAACLCPICSAVDEKASLSTPGADQAFEKYNESMAKARASLIDALDLEIAALNKSGGPDARDVASALLKRRSALAPDDLGQHGQRGADGNAVSHSGDDGSKGVPAPPPPKNTKPLVKPEQVGTWHDPVSDCEITILQDGSIYQNMKSASTDKDGFASYVFANGWRNRIISAQGDRLTIEVYWPGGALNDTRDFTRVK